MITEYQGKADIKFNDIDLFMELNVELKTESTHFSGLRFWGGTIHELAPMFIHKITWPNTITVRLPNGRESKAHITQLVISTTSGGGAAGVTTCTIHIVGDGKPPYIEE